MRGASIIGSLGVILAGWIAAAAGLFTNALAIFMVLTVSVRAIFVVWYAIHGTLETRLWRTPFAPDLRRPLRGAINTAIFWLAGAVTLEACVVPIEVGPEKLPTFHAIVWTETTLLIVLEFFPRKDGRRRLGPAFAAGTAFLAVEAALRTVSAPAGAVVLDAPFNGEWLAVQAGYGTLINAHFATRSQRHAIDFVKVEGGSTLTARGKGNEAYLSWGAPLFAPANGRVVAAVTDLPDNLPGATDRERPPGNHIVLDIGHGRFVRLSHLQRGSVRVAVGEQVRAGQILALCGNSGNTSHPHLHMQVQDRADPADRDARTFPMRFRAQTGWRGERSREDAPFYLRRNDRLVASEPSRT